MLNTTISEWGRDDLQISPIERRKMADGLFISYQKQARRGGNPLRLRIVLRGGVFFDEVRANIERPESNCGA